NDRIGVADLVTAAVSGADSRRRCEFNDEAQVVPVPWRAGPGRGLRYRTTTSGSAGELDTADQCARTAGVACRRTAGDTCGRDDDGRPGAGANGETHAADDQEARDAEETGPGDRRAGAGQAGSD